MPPIDDPHHRVQVNTTTLHSEAGEKVVLHLFDLEGLSVAEVDSLKIERESAARMQFKIDADRLLIRRAILRSLLGELTDRRAREIRFNHTPRGRPSIEGLSDLQFNTSRTGQWFIVATSHEVIPGVDIESDRAIPDLESLARRVCSPKEQEAFSGVDTASASWFLRIWTRKEAVLKASGLGLGLDPSRVTLSVESTSLTGWSPVRLDDPGLTSRILLTDVSDLQDGLFCSVAIRSPD
ncbi:MAG: hypothetical protein CBC35_06425 [Planctomycetes bacterium TMED75]|nr:hypothetical protein [Planctomycetaceae bacterium]OUU92938.1 MAG: hypothetical protein CBC35_06425 [Planctomycetes bacterium TMED75]